MDMRYTYEELWDAYQNLLRENAVLNQEIQRLKSENTGVAREKEQPDIRLSLENVRPNTLHTVINNNTTSESGIRYFHSSVST